MIGVLDAPARGELWRAEAGQGATRNGAPIARWRPTRSRRRARADRQRCPRSTAIWSPVAKPNSIALRIAMVAAGEADLVATLRWGHEWDIAAAALIAREAGAAVSDALGAAARLQHADAPRRSACWRRTPGIHAAAVERLRDRAVAAAHR